MTPTDPPTAGRARVLERLGVDYCCHGGRSLADAVSSAALELADVVAELVAVADTGDADVDRLGPVELVDHIEATHHAYLHEELPLLDALATKVRDVHGERHPERVLFPAIRRLAETPGGLPSDALSSPIRVMLWKHEAAGELLGELREITAGYAVPADGCASYDLLYRRLEALESDTFRHIHLENNVLFPAVEVRPPAR